MRLTKWYADLATTTGVQIAYRAQLAFGPLRIGYRGSLGEDGRSQREFRLSGQDMPVFDGASVAWPGLGRWHPATDRSRVLWSRHGRQVRWTLFAPNAELVNDRGAIAGRGYVERLDLEIAPWHLGLERLIWGRFVGPSRSVVWIVWHGRWPLTLALLDGEEAEANAITAARVSLAAGTVEIGPARTIVDETIGGGALPRLPLPASFALSRFLAGRERKYLAAAQWRDGDGRCEDGSAVFEEVTWPSP